MLKRYSPRTYVAAGLVGISLLLLVGSAAYVIHRHLETERQTSAFGKLAQIGANGPYTDFDGNPVDINQFAGKVLVVYAWASWSPQSEAGLRELSAISERYKDRSDVVIIALNRKETREVAHSYLDYIGNPEGLRYVFDPNDTFFSSTQSYAMPRAVIYNTNGIIAAEWQGETHESDIEAKINELLGT